MISQSMDCAGVLAHLSDLELKPNGKKPAVDLEDLCSGLDDDDEVEHEEEDGGESKKRASVEHPRHDQVEGVRSELDLGLGDNDNVEHHERGRRW